MLLSWDKALEKIFDAYAVVVDNDELLYPGEDGDELYLDSEHTTTRLYFIKNINSTVPITKDGQMVLKCDVGNEYTIGLLVRKPLNKHPITGKVKA